MANQARPAESLNEHQQRRLLVTCQHIDGLLSEVEAVLNQPASKSAFPKYVSNIPPAQRRSLEDHIAQLRAQLKRALEGQGIPLPRPSISASHAVDVSLRFMSISAEELRPRYMRGYGELPAKAASELNGIVDRLQEFISQMGQDMSREEQNGSDVN